MKSFYMGLQIVRLPQIRL